MISAYGDRQQHLLKLLLATKAGLTVDSLTQQLDISRNAVRQHLTSLELEGLVAKGVTHPTGGRPEQSYVLTPKGHELFPRKYSWFSELLLDSLKAEKGEGALIARFEKLGAQVGTQLQHAHQPPANVSERVKQLAAVMHDLGYEATPTLPSGRQLPMNGPSSVWLAILINRKSGRKLLLLSFRLPALFQPRRYCTTKVV